MNSQRLEVFRISSILFSGFRGSAFDSYCQLYHILSGNLPQNVKSYLFNKTAFQKNYVSIFGFHIWLMRKHCQSIPNEKPSVTIKKKYFKVPVVRKEIWGKPMRNWERFIFNEIFSIKFFKVFKVPVWGEEICRKPMRNWERFYWKCVKIANLSKM